MASRCRRIHPSTTHIIMLSFLCVILLGSILLALPISAADRQAVPYLDALFTATTATCVTGLVTLPTATTWSVFGQVVILLLIQVGGLGIITVMAGVMLALHRRMGLSDRLLIQDAFNLDTLSGLSSFLKRVITGTFVVEGLGAILYMTVFVPKFGSRGIWISVFNAVSAFCNAGMDIIGENSLCDFTTSLTVNAITSMLIILGGLGFIVWWDILRVLKLSIRRKSLRCLSHLTLHSKMAVTATIFLLLGGGLIILALEYANPATLGSLSFFEKIQAALFQSVTTRTAGFATVDQSALTPATTAICLILMFIGGSPVGTAGGVKTVTVLVLAAYALSTIRGKQEVGLFNRRISNDALRKSVAVVGMSFLIAAVSTLLLATVTPHRDLADILYETVSATATVGLSRSLTPHLTTAGKIIIAVTMYLGRIGPISLAVAFGVTKEKQNIVNNPTESISVG